MASPSGNCYLMSDVARNTPCNCKLFALDSVATSRESKLVCINRVVATFTCYVHGAQRGGELLRVEVADRLSYQKQGLQACEASQGVRRP